MPKTDALTRVLAIAGTLLVWLPLLAPVFFSALLLITARMFRFDYLLPAELFPVGLLGAVLLLVAALRARSRVRLVGGGLGVAVAVLVGGQALAVASGLASGAREPSSVWGALVLASIAAYSLALVAVGVGGVGLLRDLFRRGGQPAKSA